METTSPKVLFLGCEAAFLVFLWSFCSPRFLVSSAFMDVAKTQAGEPQEAPDGFFGSAFREIFALTSAVFLPYKCAFWGMVGDRP
jgi:hypothetical protein